MPTPAGEEPWRASGDDGWAGVPPALGNWKAWGVPELANFDGMVWFRRHVTLTAAQAAQPATLTLGGIDEVDQTWLNGRPIGNTFGWGTPRSYELPPGTLHEGDNLIVVNVLSTWDKGGMLGPPDAITLRHDDGTAIALGSGWRYKPVPAGVGIPPRGPWHAIGGFTTLYNAMIAPIGAYGLRGALWYQGESNTAEPDALRRPARGPDGGLARHVRARAAVPRGAVAELWPGADGTGRVWLGARARRAATGGCRRPTRGSRGDDRRR